MPRLWFPKRWSRAKRKAARKRELDILRFEEIFREYCDGMNTLKQEFLTMLSQRGNNETKKD